MVSAYTFPTANAASLAIQGAAHATAIIGARQGRPLSGALSPRRSRASTLLFHRLLYLKRGSP